MYVFNSWLKIILRSGALLCNIRALRFGDALAQVWSAKTLTGRLCSLHFLLVADLQPPAALLAAWHKSSLSTSHPSAASHGAGVGWEDLGWGGSLLQERMHAGLFFSLLSFVALLRFFWALGSTASQFRLAAACTLKLSNLAPRRPFFVECPF